MNFADTSLVEGGKKDVTSAHKLLSESVLVLVA